MTTATPEKAIDDKLGARAYLLQDVAEPGVGPVVYFAHSLRDYGTDRAEHARQVIRSARRRTRLLDPELIDRWEELVAVFGSTAALYTAIVELVDEVAVLEHENHVGRGVYFEVGAAQRRGIKRWAVRGEILVPVLGIEVVDDLDPKVRYGRLLTGPAMVATTTVGASQ